jgi:hypothetical protein
MKGGVQGLIGNTRAAEIESAKSESREEQKQKILI